MPIKQENLYTAAPNDHNEAVDPELNGPAKAESTINPPNIGPYITIETEKKRKRQALFTTTTSRLCDSKSHMIFLGFIDVQSIRYTKIPTTWPQCNVFQQNQLTCHLNPGLAGVFSVPIRDQQACQLLGLSAGGNGREALIAALASVGKFRYGLKEPAKEYYRLSVTEKILHLFFATFPPCPQNGGFVIFPKSKSSLPADGDEVWLECFNYYAHAKRPKRIGVEQREGNTNNRQDRLAKLLLPGIAEKMKTLREKLMQVNKSIE
ncbi:uncharacterized protein LOC128713072 [Anopheles marshallii]|uniref:uncharacterized protein LOC128713072 n=1 Tax=Anopheles marshallii TaxID=1521116 RepID=UPI00237A316A|nr:uncharacterized protein LOC128713072 [Anopheles marshallii]